ncbi:uncharacterized protein MELLADRAFT_58946 [Melampsora larici-populina 98AG31]|uniref:Uncharacterized protein n=1 Tax=Melampsora larici-populina (strain 98AG31 / pathotype 3-4-7) TaxID=747676 RepID=F4R6H7_MELLP|nr:uncharacterized protein MELLADRAFT_58946 [Melampsora larici-populina 98AG31]EGG11882.1 hypothetical protein MELLADRAFT_58946 [Melampsora larici-populina 98AG31]
MPIKDQVSSRGPGTIVGEVHSYVGSDIGEAYLIDKTRHHVPLRDLRTINEAPDLKTWGFTYVSGRHVGGIENLEELSDKNQAALKADSVELVKKLTGATTVYALQGGYRYYEPSGSVRSVPIIHSDWTLEGAKWFKTRARKELLASENPTEVKFGKYVVEGKDVVIYNVWRPLHTVQDNHLGLCRWDSRLKEDALTSIPKVTNLKNALQPWRYSEAQKWYYLREQKAEDVFVFMQHDARAPDGHGINVPHAAFKLEGSQGPDTRKSYEIRVIAFIEPSIKRRLLRLKDRIKSTSPKFKWNSSRNLEKRKPS